MRKIIAAFVLCVLGISLCSCKGQTDDLSQLNYSYMCDEKSLEAVTDKEEDNLYLYQPETMRARDREVIIIGTRYKINVDIDAIMKEGDWDSYEFKKVDPTPAYTDQEGNVYLDKDTINENAFRIDNNEIVGWEKGRYGVYLKLTKKKETLLRYIGDYIVTDENY
ncbi:MAG: hypothetical protein K2O22_04975, partial [Anaeroplasmataceae bacterium]|nr:hypothetical protein [Anaeroplasmataceae bacterium]